jgi:hypothetical protein
MKGCEAAPTGEFRQREKFDIAQHETTRERSFNP